MPDGMGTLDGTYLIVEGEFIAVNEGDKTKRVMIALWPGRQRHQNTRHRLLVNEGHKTVVLECNLNAQSGKKPGAIIGLGGGNVAVSAGDGRRG